MECKGFVRGRSSAWFHTIARNPSEGYTALHMVKKIWNRMEAHPYYDTFCGQVPIYEEFHERPPQGSHVCRTCQRMLNAATRKEQGIVSHPPDDKLPAWRKDLESWRNGEGEAKERLTELVLNAYKERKLHDRITVASFLKREESSFKSMSPRVSNPYYRFAENLLDAMFQAGILRRDREGWYLLAEAS
ncbi:MAG TPA: hypothetical protein VFI02_15350 [Armatimonadota bacterium]|nr:hypothetical protein [Armatimonadota bacterium]